MRHLTNPFAPLAGAFFLALVCLPAGSAEKPRYPSVDAKKEKDYSQDIPGTKVKFDMVAIPGGEYLRGSPATEKGRNADEGPAHPVKLKPFWMGKHEVTWDEFDAFWRAKPGRKADKEPEMPKDADAVTRPTPPYADETFGLGREGYPVICITHHCAMQYCRWLSLKTGKAYRLPTEAEWEWACRAGTTAKWSHGDDEDKLGDYAWFTKNSEDRPQPVGKKKPNPWGLHDMHGNVAEWCLDKYEEKFYGTFDLGKLAIQPVNKPDEKRFSHPVRGGSWADDAAKCRSAARMKSVKDWMQLDPNTPKSIWWLTSAEFVGFRVVRAVEEQENLKGVRSLITRDSR
ncbi:MAG: formylglycine-generating enzyme family protein [Gemmataceae bacterium]|nr:formylglycine-generating enzyme family protein [Gemmataceae bacterium]